MAALTRSGARKASEIAMLTFRALQFSRLAMVSALAVGSAISSSSQRRPRAIAATNVTRVSERYRASPFRADPFGQKNFTTSPGRYLLPRNRKSIWWLAKLDDQLVGLDLNAGDVSIDEASVVNGLRSFDMVPN